jgi:predicted acylesterase/phospholipase RssA
MSEPLPPPVVIDPTPRPDRRLGLCLCGGGATGAAYEIGALAALEAAVPGFRTTQFDVVVGTSAGSLIAALVAGGVSATRMYHAITTGDAWFRVDRADVYQPDWDDTWRNAGRVGRALLRLGVRAMRDRGQSVGAAWADLAAALPDGLFSLNRYQRWVDRTLQRMNVARWFEDVPAHLLIPANNLDTGHRQVFGRGYRIDVTVPEAIAASSAIPLFFSPVRLHGSDYVDGGSGRVAHVDLAQRAGCTHVLVVNPIVPWNLERRLRESRPDDAEMEARSLTRIRARGMVGIWNQCFRMGNNVKLHMGLRRFRADRPDIGLALIEPDERDETLFVTNAMDTSARAGIARHAFDTTVARLRSGDEAVRAVCLGLRHACNLDGLRRRGVAAR